MSNITHRAKKKRKFTDAGGIQKQAVYTARKTLSTVGKRGKKEKPTNEAQRRMNNIYQYEKLEELLATNFQSAGSANVFTLTFDDKHLPRSKSRDQEREMVKNKVKYFLKKLRDARKETGLPEPVALGTIESLTAVGERWHVHLVLDNTGKDYDIVRKAWIYGTQIEAEPLRVDSEKNWETLAKYMTKEARERQDSCSKPGQHAWFYTRNIKRPIVEVEWVDEDTDIIIPEGTIVMQNEKVKTEFGSCHYVKYRYPASDADRALVSGTPPVS